MHSTTLHNLLSMARRRQIRGHQGAAGFTLVELMIVVVIIGVLAAVGVPQYLGVANRSKAKTYAAEALNAAKECAALQLEGNTGSTVKTPDGDKTCEGSAEVTFDSQAFPVALSVQCPNPSTAVDVAKDAKLPITVSTDGIVTCE